MWGCHITGEMRMPPFCHCVLQKHYGDYMCMIERECNIRYVHGVVCHSKTWICGQQYHQLVRNQVHTAGCNLYFFSLGTKTVYAQKHAYSLAQDKATMMGGGGSRETNRFTSQILKITWLSISADSMTAFWGSKMNWCFVQNHWTWSCSVADGRTAIFYIQCFQILDPVFPGSWPRSPLCLSKGCLILQ